MTATLTPSSLPILTRLGITPDRLRHIPPGHRRSQCRAIINWLTRYSPAATASNLEQVKGYLQAFYHLCNMKEWERAFSLVSVKLNTPSQETLHYQLKLWGYSQERTALYQALAESLAHCSPDGWSARILQFLGESLYTQGQYREAYAYYQQSLDLFRTVGDAIDVGLLLCAIGDTHYAQGNYDLAIEHHEQLLDIVQAANLSFAEGIALGSLGNIYEAKGNYHKAKGYHQQHLEIARQTQDMEMEGAALGNLGACYHSLGDYAKATNYHQQHLAILHKERLRHRTKNWQPTGRKQRLRRTWQRLLQFRRLCQRQKLLRAAAGDRKRHRRSPG